MKKLIAAAVEALAQWFRDLNCWQSFTWNFEGTGAQTYVQSVEFKQYDYQNQGWITIQSIDWGSSILYGIFDNQ